MKLRERLALVVLTLGAWAAVAHAQRVEFNRDIRPILSDNCFACHGHDKNRREGELRLDTEAGLLGEGDEPGQVTPGKPSESELLHRITSKDDDERMPPPDSGKEISAEQADLVRRWIEQGAEWQGHWAFQPIKRPVPPEVDGGDFVRNPIDRFVLRALREKGLAASAEADRITLIRRLNFDLLGLPPTVEEVDAFVADRSDRAYEALVDRQLESPHYGERMALWWLDLVRYADSVGYHGDQPVSVYPFRDYVIGAFNENKRFDRFTLEQLAGDLLPEATLQQRIASGYNRLGMMSAEGGVQPKEYLAKYIAERVRNLGGTWLGITTGCCECHDHKYDAFTMRDFYGLEAFFADIQERGLYSGAHRSGAWGPMVKLPTPEQSTGLARLDERIAEAKTLLDTTTPELAAAQAEWEHSRVPWTALDPRTFASAGGATLTKQDDLSILASGAAPDKDAYTITVVDPPRDVTALRLEVLPDDSLPKKGPGRAGTGNFVLTEFVILFNPAADVSADEASGAPASDGSGTPAVQASGARAKLRSAAASFEQSKAGETTPYDKWTILGAIDDDVHGSSHGWAVLEQVGRANFAVFEPAETIVGGEGSTLTIELRQHHDNPGHTLGRFRLLATSAPRPVKLEDAPPVAIEAILSQPSDRRSEVQKEALSAHYRSIAPALDPVRKRLEASTSQRAQLDKAISTTLVTVAVAPRTIRLLPRGNWMDDSGAEMEPAFPAILSSSERADKARRNRVDLARWLTAPENPLTARTFVNRMWKLFHGAGLSRRLDDLGAQGEWPSHPALLDWLAGEFIDSGWDVKRLVKLIVTSGTYRRSSLETPRQREIDPYNRWLARQARFRLDAEMVRDNALKMSGLSNERIGGPSVKPYQPRGYWAYLNFPAREWENDQGADLYRRGLYTHWQRQYLHPSLLAFDAPSREECVADRPRSNTPLQSLVLLNDPIYVEAARAFAEEALRQEVGTAKDRLDWAFRRALSRRPEPREAQVLLGLLARHRSEYERDPHAVAELLSVGAHPKPADLDEVELAAWTSVTRALLTLHETITRN